MVLLLSYMSSEVALKLMLNPCWYGVCKYLIFLSSVEVDTTFEFKCFNYVLCFSP